MEYTIEKVKDQIRNLVANAVEVKIDKEKLEITVPPESDMGDFSVPCFYLTKVIKNSPNQIAEELKQKINPAGIIKSVQNIGSYLNFFVNPEIFSREVLKEINKNGTDYGRLSLSKEKVMIEFSQPNTHKEFHVGHSRNAILGNSLLNLYRFGGYKVVPVSYVGDIGSHVAKCLWALERFHKDGELPGNKGKFLGQVYTEASRKTEDNENYKKEADEILQKLESGEKKWITLWKKTRKWSLDDFDNIYKILGIKFDHVFYESEVAKPGKKIVEDLLKRGLAEKSEGAVIINLEKENLKVLLLLKSDGSSLYSTKELALAELKFNKFKIDKSLVVVDARQSFYFQQLFKTLELMGFKKDMVHIPYEFVTLKEGAMSSRKGNVILFEDFYNQVVIRATQETKKRHSDWSEKKIEETANKIALSAIKFNMLKTSSNNVIVFDIEEALSFDGFSGPYLQYTVSRISSVLKKDKPKAISSVDFSKLTNDIERELSLKLADFPEVVKDAIKTNEPSEVSRYLFELSKLFSNFYQTVPILSSANKEKQARLILIRGVKQVLENGLDLLGIDVLEQM